MTRSPVRRSATHTADRAKFRAWVISIICFVAIACAGGLARAAGAPSSAVGALAVAAMAIVSGASMLRVASAPGPARPAARWAAVAAVVATAAAPAIAAMLPGGGIASGVLRNAGDEILLPEGESGPVRVLVAGKLPGSSITSARYTLAIDGDRIEGTFQRSIRRAWKKMGRFFDERTSEYHPMRVAPGARALTLERVEGRLEDGIHVRVFRIRMPGWLLAFLCMASLALAAAVDALDRRQGIFAVFAGIALATGALTRWTATPDSAFASAVASIAPGVLLGAAAGLAASAVARRVRSRLVN